MHYICLHYLICIQYYKYMHFNVFVRSSTELHAYFNCRKHEIWMYLICVLPEIMYWLSCLFLDLSKKINFEQCRDCVAIYFFGWPSQWSMAPSWMFPYPSPYPSEMYPGFIEITIQMLTKDSNLFNDRSFCTLFFSLLVSIIL